MTSAGRSVLRIAAASLLAIPGLPEVATASDFEVRLTPGDTEQGTSPVFLTHDSGTSKAQGYAAERLSAKTSAFASAPFALITTSENAAASVFATYDDIVISGPTPTVTTTLRVPFSAIVSDTHEVWSGLQFGFHSTTTSTVMFHAAFSSASASVNFRIIPYDAIADVTVQNSAGASSTPVVHQTQFFSDFPIPLEGSNGSDAFAGLRGTEVFGVSGEMTLSAEVPTNTLLTLDLSLSLGSAGQADFLAGASSVINAPSSFGIPQREPVFDLPDGYTANSPSLLLVDNFVPEPSSGAASLAAFAGLFALGRRRDPRPRALAH